MTERKVRKSPPARASLQVPGFTVGSTAAGLRHESRLDLCVIASDRPCAAAGVFTRNRVVGAPVRLDRAHLRHAAHRAIVVNSEISTVGTGPEGGRAARAMADGLARLAGCDRREVFVASTGVIGPPLPMDKIMAGIDLAWSARTPKGWTDAARAIMTTDTRPKIAHRSLRLGGKKISLAGIAKGSGMIHPNMATMLSFIATDAAVEKSLLQSMLGRVADRSFHCVTVDGDTSTSDTVLVLANGAAGNRMIGRAGPKAAALEDALNDLSVELAREIARDGEGAEHLITIRVEGAPSDKAARQVAMTVANSPLVKTAIFGRDANVGRIPMAVGRAGVPFSQNNLSIHLNEIHVLERGRFTDYDEADLTRTLARKETAIDISVGPGRGAATVWTCDLTYGYIRINADYRT